MNRFSFSIMLQYKNAWTFRILGVVFHPPGTLSAFDNIFDWNRGFRQLVVSVIRYPDLPARNQLQDSFPCFTPISILSHERAECNSMREGWI